MPKPRNNVRRNNRHVEPEPPEQIVEARAAAAGALAKRLNKSKGRVGRLQTQMTKALLDLVGEVDCLAAELPRSEAKALLASEWGFSRADVNTYLNYTAV